MNDVNDVSCRRCGRALRGRLAAQARIGGRCALREAVEAAQRAQQARGGAGVHEAAVALITARLGALPEGVADAIAAEAPGIDLPVLLADLMAFAVANTVRGPEWLRELALAWAQDGEAS